VALVGWWGGAWRARSAAWRPNEGVVASERATSAFGHLWRVVGDDGGGEEPHAGIRRGLVKLVFVCQNALVKPMFTHFRPLYENS
jgi:hypothetical protein